MAGQGKARPGEAGQGTARHGEARQGTAGQGKARQGKAIARLSAARSNQMEDLNDKEQTKCQKWKQQ
jgi:hypothetical protein